jgi:hypothetical protein
MSRLDTIKRLGFPPEECPSCLGKGCEHCDNGTFKQRVKSDWEPPTIQRGQYLLAYFDVDRWSFIGVADADGPVLECDFPFEADFAMGNHFKSLGFRIEQ